MKHGLLRLGVLLGLGWSAATAAPVPVIEAGQPALTPQSIKALENRLSALESQNQNQGVLALYSEIEQLKSELARLKGAQEELLHRLALAEQRQKDLYADLDGRLKGLAVAQTKASQAVVTTPSAAAPATGETVVPENETKVYEDALAAVKAGNHQAAIIGLQTFLKNQPNSALASNAQYWIGFSQFSMGDFKAAAESHQKLIQAYPDSPKVPDAMLGMARAKLQLNDAKAAQSTLDQIVKQYAGSKAAENAQKLLSTLK